MDNNLVDKLESAKELAVADCDYELAANLRDLIKYYKENPKKEVKAETKSSPEPKFINQQPSENLVKHVRPWVDIVDVYLTIQGEGPFHGRPAIFIRTAGCNLSEVCKGCDTDYTTNRKVRYISDIIVKVKQLRKKGLIVITGGEPLRQSTIGDLCAALLNEGYSIQIETNGTYWWEDIPKEVIIVCSPKTPKLHPNLRVDAFKFVLTAGEIDEADGLPTSVLGSSIKPYRPPDRKIPIYVAPADTKDPKQNEENLRAAIQSVLTFDYILSLQEQKLIGLP